MEEAHGVGKRILDEHALGIAGNQLFGRYAELIGEQSGGFAGGTCGWEHRVR